MQLAKLVRPNILGLSQYVSARSIYSDSDAVLLDANENGRDVFGSNFNRYPDPLQQELKEKLALQKGINSSNIFLGNGSDEAIDLLIRIFCQPGKDQVVICPPTYGMYKVQADIQGVEVKKVMLDTGFGLRPNAILEEASETAKLLFLCSPNNPTGNLMDEQAVEHLLQNFPGIVVLDEAYIDFAPVTSWVHRLNDFPNLVVLQTMSKAWGLAGIRVGMAFASAEIIALLNKVKFPYNISRVQQAIALDALGEQGKVEQSITENEQEKQRLISALQALPMVQEIYPSAANFLLVKFEKSPQVFTHLLNKKIVVRDRSNEPLCVDCLRVTVGGAEENDQLIRALNSIKLK